MILEIEYFENKEVNRIFEIWLANYPLSYGGSDMDHWTKFVLLLLENHVELDYTILRKGLNDYKHKPKELQIDGFMSRYGSMRDLYSLMNSEGKILK